MVDNQSKRRRTLGPFHDSPPRNRPAPKAAPTPSETAGSLPTPPARPEILLVDLTPVVPSGPETQSSSVVPGNQSPDTATKGNEFSETAPKKQLAAPKTATGKTTKASAPNNPSEATETVPDPPNPQQVPETASRPLGSASQKRKATSRHCKTSSNDVGTPSQGPGTPSQVANTASERVGSP